MEKSSFKLLLNLLHLDLHLHSQLGQGLDWRKKSSKYFWQNSLVKEPFSLKNREKKNQFLLYIEYISTNLWLENISFPFFQDLETLHFFSYLSMLASEVITIFCI